MPLVKDLGLCGLDSLCEHVCFNKTLFINTGNSLDLAQRPHFPALDLKLKKNTNQQEKNRKMGKRLGHPLNKREYPDGQ